MGSHKPLKRTASFWTRRQERINWEFKMLRRKTAALRKRGYRTNRKHCTRQAAAKVSSPIGKGSTPSATLAKRRVLSLGNLTLSASPSEEKKFIRRCQSMRMNIREPSSKLRKQSSRSRACVEQHLRHLMLDTSKPQCDQHLVSKTSKSQLDQPMVSKTSKLQLDQHLVSKTSKSQLDQQLVSKTSKPIPDLLVVSETSQLQKRDPRLVTKISKPLLNLRIVPEISKPQQYDHRVAVTNKPPQERHLVSQTSQPQSNRPLVSEASKRLSDRSLRSEASSSICRVRPQLSNMQLRSHSGITATKIPITQSPGKNGNTRKNCQISRIDESKQCLPSRAVNHSHMSENSSVNASQLSITDDSDDYENDSSSVFYHSSDSSYFDDEEHVERKKRILSYPNRGFRRDLSDKKRKQPCLVRKMAPVTTQNSNLARKRSLEQYSDVYDNVPTDASHKRSKCVQPTVQSTRKHNPSTKHISSNALRHSLIRTSHQQFEQQMYDTHPCSSTRHYYEKEESSNMEYFNTEINRPRPATLGQSTNTNSRSSRQWTMKSTENFTEYKHGKTTKVHFDKNDYYYVNGREFAKRGNRANDSQTTNESVNASKLSVSFNSEQETAWPWSNIHRHRNNKESETEESSNDSDTENNLQQFCVKKKKGGLKPILKNGLKPILKRSSKTQLIPPALEKKKKKKWSTRRLYSLEDHNVEEVASLSTEDVYGRRTASAGKHTSHSCDRRISADDSGDEKTTICGSLKVRDYFPQQKKVTPPKNKRVSSYTTLDSRIEAQHYFYSSAQQKHHKAGRHHRRRHSRSGSVVETLKKTFMCVT